MSQKPTLGQILIQKNMVSAEKIDQALQIQAGGNRRLGQILIQMGAITDEQLFTALSDQHGIPITELKGDIPGNVKQILPRYLCRKYAVFPFETEDGNILKIAMVNPLDQAARTDVESFSGMLVKPFLAKETQVAGMIGRHIPLSVKDVFYPLIYNKTAAFICGIALVLAVAVGIFTHREIQLQKYGTISQAGELKVFSNHEMLIGVEGKGAISLIGHGPYAKGFYSVVFGNTDELMTFVDEKKTFLTQEQYEWVNWVAKVKLPEMK